MFCYVLLSFSKVLCLWLDFPCRDAVCPSVYMCEHRTNIVLNTENDFKDRDYHRHYAQKLILVRSFVLLENFKP